MKPKSGLFAFLGSARAAVGSFRKIGQFFDHLNFETYEPGSLYVGPILAKIFLKIDEIKIRPLTPPRIISIHYLYWLLTRVYRKVGKKWLICIFGLRPCSGGVISENWTIF